MMQKENELQGKKDPTIYMEYSNVNCCWRFGIINIVSKCMSNQNNDIMIVLHNEGLS